MKAIGPKEALLKSQREENALDIPTFLKRPNETDEQAEKRRKKYKPRDTTGGLKVIEPVAPIPEKIKKAIEKDLRDDAPAIPIAELHAHAHPAAKANAESWDKIPAIKKAKPAKEKKLPRAVEKALAEKTKVETLAKAQPMETTVKTATKKKANGSAKKTERTNGKYDWTAAEALAKLGKIPTLPPFNSYRSQIKKFRDLAVAKDTKGIKEFSETFCDEKGARANMFRFRDLCLVALRR